ncbi:right-handed parallel beta-helix repeat-containing protein [Pontixanthobacter sp. CEM42]|uniref:right-handed parallel beta-helix repeat-containing protein n=1 Tax=Pontixanthobacter sp. CEM42 TaxID=2792077 RepID=UPI001ADF627C|nr:right-handed parallel beta-helix repeat-containing protein [Pontixanthobacter sp. CEM42]
MEHYAQARLEALPARPSLKIAALVAAVAIAAIPAASVFAQSNAAFTVVESGRGYERLQDAVNAIGNGSGTIAVAAGTHRQCAVQEGGSIAYMAAVPGKAIFDGVTCEGKAALVLRGREASVSGLVFRRMAVPDFNGAGIRLEQGDLTVAQSWFLDSQQGILSANDSNSQIVIDKSTFSGLGTCEGSGGCAHSVYIGDYGHLRITRSRFEKGTGGHYVKARAKRVDVASSSFDDSAGRGTNYMIDLPAGAVGQITNNWFVQGQNKENYSAFIAVGAEDKLHTSDGLQIAGNDARLAPSVRRNTIFVADWSGDNLDIGPNNLGQGLERFESR